MICSFFIQSLWTQERRFAVSAEWLKLGLVFFLVDYLPLNPIFLLVIQGYLASSAVLLAWLSFRSTRNEPLTQLS